jgi:hypothetical protein
MRVRIKERNKIVFLEFIITKLRNIFKKPSLKAMELESLLYL